MDIRNEKKRSSILDDVFTSREAASVWELSENTVTQWCNRGRFEEHEAKKSGKVWLVTRQGMERLTGKITKEE